VDGHPLEGNAGGVCDCGGTKAEKGTVVVGKLGLSLKHFGLVAAKDIRSYQPGQTRAYDGEARL
jgi:hypothetical protein